MTDHNHPGSPPGCFIRGDLKYLILEQLKEKPAHGYRLMREMGKGASAGPGHSPSPGSVYPALNRLEAAGLTRAVERDGKKYYSITEAGRKFLHDREGALDAIKARRRVEREEPEAMDAPAQRLAQQLEGLRESGLEPVRLKRIREALERCEAEIRSILES